MLSYLSTTNVRVHAQGNELLAVVIDKLLAAGTDEASVASCTLKADQKGQEDSHGPHSLSV